MIFLLGIAILITSCKKDDDDNKPDSNSIVGTWELVDYGGISWYNDTKFWIFTSDNQFYQLEEDNLGFRDLLNDSYQVVQNSILFDGDDAYNFSINNNTITFIDEDGAHLIFEKSGNINPNDWVQEINVGNVVFVVSGSNHSGICWTGQTLWCSFTHFNAGDALAEIDIYNSGFITQILAFQVGPLGFSNNYMLRGIDGKIVLHNPSSGVVENEISLPNYSYFRGVCYDGNNIWFVANNGQASQLVETDFNGSIITTIENFKSVTDITYYNGYLWILYYDLLFKFDTTNLKAVKTYRLIGLGMLSNGFTDGIEFINDTLWIMNGEGGFYNVALN